MPINETHDPNLKSWVESANDPKTDFPIQNLPICRFADADGEYTGVRVGDAVFNLWWLAVEGMLGEDPGLAGALQFGDDLCAGGSSAIRAIRKHLQRILAYGQSRPQDSPRARAMCQASEVQLLELVHPANYTDFYASIHHAATVGAMFRPDNPLLPNYKHVPIGYHGRASSIVPSGSNIRRPRGQQAPPDNDPKAGPSFGPCKMLDYELEVGAFIGPGNSLGEAVAIDKAEEHIFGLCLVNDWSARDIQKWEYQPLGPFLAKNFGTTISPYIVTLEALEPFRCPAYKRPAGDPRPLPYLFSEADQSRGGFDITLEVYLQSEQMRARGLSPVLLSKSNAFKDMYWTFAQMLTHHASNGCNMQSGDLIASGTVSGLGAGERGCLLELTWQGNGPDGKPLPRKPVQLPTGEARSFLADGDEVIFRGYCEREGFRRIGFGECRGRIVAALT
jgi:fumarylacetoacetase